MNFSSISGKAMIAGAALLILIGVTAGAGVWTSVNLSQQLKAATRSASVLRSHMYADMMHDALRADVLSALRATDSASGASLASVSKDLKTHTDAFREAITRSRTLAADPTTKAALAAVEAPLNAYISSANDIVAAAGRDPADAEARMPDFIQRFDALAERMEQASTTIEAASQSAADRAGREGVLAQIMMSVMLLVGILFSITLILIARKGLVSPLVDITAALTRLASGDLSVEPTHTGRKDEIGAMTKALFAFRQAVAERQAEMLAAEDREQIEQERRENERRRAAEKADQDRVVSVLAEGLSDLARGDLTHRIETPFPGEYERLRTDFNAAISELQSAIRRVSDATSDIQTGAGQISHASDDLASRTERQAASLEQTSAALHEVSATVKSAAETAQQARVATQDASREAEQSGVIVRDATSAMSEIEQSSQQISKIIGVIDEIAFQTNLLALNAGVEAARAGDAGRGFAVVAQEVRALAQRSAEAAQEIKLLISASTRQVGQGVALVDQTGAALLRIVEQVSKINTLISGIAASSQEQSTALFEVSTAVNQMDQVTQQNAAMVEETTAASHGLAQQAEVLAALISRFTIASSAEESRAGIRSMREDGPPIAMSA